MATIRLKAITKFSRDTTANWNRFPNIVPEAGEAIVYSDYSSYQDDHNNTVYVPGIKIGDGLAYLADLPFVGGPGYDGPSFESIVARLGLHENNASMHVSSEDRAKWDNKLNCEVSGETLILTRN